MTMSVLPADIDEQNHVNNTVYLRWIQDIATAHWKSLASAEAQAGIAWVVLRHEIDYKSPASLGDEIVLMNEGRIVQKGSIVDLREQPTSTFVTEFINAQRGLMLT